MFRSGIERVGACAIISLQTHAIMPARTATSSKPAVEKGAAKATKSKGTPKTELKDWRDNTLERMRALIMEADPRMVEERKWKKPSNPAGVAVWSHDGIICTGETYKDKVKLTFMHGAAINDPAGLFNAPGTGATRRAMDIREGGTVDAAKFKALVKAAVARNTASKKDKKNRP